MEGKKKLSFPLCVLLEEWKSGGIENLLFSWEEKWGWKMFFYKFTFMPFLHYNFFVIIKKEKYYLLSNKIMSHFPSTRFPPRSLPILGGFIFGGPGKNTPRPHQNPPPSPLVTKNIKNRISLPFSLISFPSPNNHPN